MKIKKVDLLSGMHLKIIAPCPVKAMISICTPNNSVKLNSAWTTQNLLRLEFDDINEMMVNKRLISNDDARLLINFAESLRNKIMFMFVHCDIGVGRSSAVAKFVSGIYGLPFPENYKFYNTYIYDVLVENYKLWQMENKL